MTLRPIMHSVVWAPSVGPPTTQIPFIVNADGTLSVEFYRFIGAPRYYSRSQSWRATAARGVALLLDLEEGPRISPSQGNALDELRSGLLNGLKIDFGTSRPHLLWEPCKPAYAEQLYGVARQFADYRSGRGSDGNTTTAIARDSSILRHLKAAPDTAHLQAASAQKTVAAPFPLQYIPDFFSALDEGAASANHALRDRLYFILLAFAGLRRSEPLHLWIQDVELTPAGRGSVFFYHPDYGPAEPGRRNSETRRTALQRKYSRIPRNLLGKTDPNHAGWKGTGNEAGGVVPGNGITMATKAKFDAAQVECAKFGKLARVKKISAWDGTMTYECVAKDAPSE